jgi:putative CocE/NonD family hydrolase
VSPGYVHVIVSQRGTGESSGGFGFFDEQERQDLYDVVEWAAEQPWSDGNVGMIGISYFAITGRCGGAASCTSRACTASSGASTASSPPTSCG